MGLASTWTLLVTAGFAAVLNLVCLTMCIMGVSRWMMCFDHLLSAPVNTYPALLDILLDAAHLSRQQHCHSAGLLLPACLDTPLRHAGRAQLNGKGLLVRFAERFH